MKILTAACLVHFMVIGDVMAENVRFEDATIGIVPSGWLATKTGAGEAKWTVERDESGSIGLKQSGKATYPLALLQGTSLKDGFVSVKFKAISGQEDRAGGIVWRAQDENNYYVVRANALENNVVLYKTVDGKRSSLDIVGETGGYGVKVPVQSGAWHTLRIEFSGSRFAVRFDGVKLFEVEDATFPDSGMVGLWTKADSVTMFDDFQFEAVP